MAGIDDGSEAVLRWSTPKIFAVGDDRPVDTDVRWSFSSRLAAMLLEEEPARTGNEPFQFTIRPSASLKMRLKFLAKPAANCNRGTFRIAKVLVYKASSRFS